MPDLSKIALFLISTTPLLATEAATVDVMFEDFETASSNRTGVAYTTAHPNATTNILTNSYIGVVELNGGASAAANLAADVTFSNVQGNDFYALQDLNGAISGVTSQTLNWTGIEITGFTELTLSFFVAEDDAIAKLSEPSQS